MHRRRGEGKSPRGARICQRRKRTKEEESDVDVGLDGDCGVHRQGRRESILKELPPHVMLQSEPVGHQWRAGRDLKKFKGTTKHKKGGNLQGGKSNGVMGGSPRIVQGRPVGGGRRDSGKTTPGKSPQFTMKKNGLASRRRLKDHDTGGKGLTDDPHKEGKKPGGLERTAKSRIARSKKSRKISSPTKKKEKET